MDTRGPFGASPYSVSDLQLFSGADAAAVRAALAECPVLRLAAGDKLPDAAQPRLYIVLRGVLGVRTGDGPLSKVYPGESVGEQAVLEEAASPAEVSAVDDAELLVLEAEQVWDLIDHHHGVARNLLRLLSFRIRAANALSRRRQKLGEFYRQLSMNDGLTGLYNRAWLNDVLPGLVAGARGSGAPFSVVMIDLDHFKHFNDTHGHQAGDDALRTAAQVLLGALRPTDYAVRYGGEEMIVLLPDTPETVALMVAERLCKRLRQAVVFGDMRIAMPQVTASMGVACLQPGDDEQALVAQADAALYRAKEGGRNRASL
ncbi:MAG: GGDEF domain-containing protein [Telluria sp.]